MPSSFSYRFSPASEPTLIISVSKKVAKSAVDRNTIKRRVRAALRPLLPLKAGTHMFIARAGSDKVKGTALKEELKNLIQV